MYILVPWVLHAHNYSGLLTSLYLPVSQASPSHPLWHTHCPVAGSHVPWTHLEQVFLHFRPYCPAGHAEESKFYIEHLDSAKSGYWIAIQVYIFINYINLSSLQTHGAGRSSLWGRQGRLFVSLEADRNLQGMAHTWTSEGRCPLGMVLEVNIIEINNY